MTQVILSKDLSLKLVDRARAKLSEVGHPRSELIRWRDNPTLMMQKLGFIIEQEERWALLGILSAELH